LSATGNVIRSGCARSSSGTAAMALDNGRLLRYAGRCPGRPGISGGSPATGRFGIPRKIAENTIETALTLDSELSHDVRDDFLARIFDPDKGRSPT
jgi:hypothetical protein